MIRSKKINNVKIQLLPKVDFNKDNIKGQKLLNQSTPYFNLAIISKKFSGKTTMIFNVIKNIINTDTTIVIFANTVYTDNSYLKMVEHFEEKGNVCMTYDSIFDEDGENLVENYLHQFNEVNKQKLMEEMKKKNNIEEPCNKIDVDSDSEDDDVKTYKRKPKKMAPEYVFCFDDISNEIANKSIIKLTKQHRHYKSCVLLSSQQLHDIPKQMLIQMNYISVFKNFDLEKLEYIIKHCALNIDLPQMKKYYEYATSGDFNFLLIDRDKEEYKKNFNELLYIE